MTFVVSDAILGGSVLKQVQNSSHRTGAAVRAGRDSGAATIEQLYGVRMEEVTTLTSGDVEGMVGFNSGNFLTEGLGVTAGTVTVPYKNRANVGLFQSGLNHSQLTGANALIIPTGFEATQDSEVGATGTCEVHWRSTNGTTQSTTGSAGNSLATEAFNLEFALGPVTLNGSAISSVTGIRINPGHSVVKQSQAGGTWPVEISIQKADPSIDITLHDVDEAIVAADAFAGGLLVAYFRARADGSIYEADVSTSHMRWTFAAGISHADTIDAPETGNGSVTVRVFGKALACTTGSAIT